MEAADIKDEVCISQVVINEFFSFVMRAEDEIVVLLSVHEILKLD